MSLFLLARESEHLVVEAVYPMSYDILLTMTLNSRHRAVLQYSRKALGDGICNSGVRRKFEFFRRYIKSY